MKKPILIAILIVALAFLFWGAYGGYKNLRDDTYERGQLAGFELTGQAILTQLSEEGRLVITFNDNEGNPQSITLIPLTEQ